MTVITSGYSRNTWNSGAWNRSVVNRSVTVSGVSLSTTLRSIEVIIPGTAFPTGVSLISASGTPNILADSNTTLTGVSSSFSVNNVSIGLVQQVNAVGVATNFALGSSSIAANSNLILTGVSSLFNTGAITVERGPSVPVTGTSASFSVNSVNPQAGANPVFYISKTFKVKVRSTSGGNKYLIDGKQQYGLNLAKGRNLFTFDQSDSSNDGHPLRFSLTPNGTHGGGTEFTTNVQTVGTPGNPGAYSQIFVANNGPTRLYYYCTVHSGMGSVMNFNSVLSMGVGTTSIGGNSNLVLTGVRMNMSTQLRGIWSPKIFGNNQLWKAKKI
tara:strand:- start:497 stop:1477 length:981 start_codon:yes stop_codon:yes gene_type:complete